MYQVTADGDYKLIGVTTAGMRCCAFMGMYTPIDVVHDYLKTALPDAIGVDPAKQTAPAGK